MILSQDRSDYLLRDSTLHSTCSSEHYFIDQTKLQRKVLCEKRHLSIRIAMTLLHIGYHFDEGSQPMVMKGCNSRKSRKPFIPTNIKYQAEPESITDYVVTFYIR